MSDNDHGFRRDRGSVSRNSSAVLGAPTSSAVREKATVLQLQRVESDANSSTATGFGTCGTGSGSPKLFDLFDGDGNYLRSKKAKGKFRGVETRLATKPPRG